MSPILPTHSASSSKSRISEPSSPILGSAISSPKPSPFYTLAALGGAVASFELLASVWGRHSPRCSYPLKNTVRIPSTLSEYLDNRMVKRSDEPLWINDFAVDFQRVHYFCKDTGVNWFLPFFAYLCCIFMLYQRFRGNRTQDWVIGGAALVGALVGAIAHLSFLEVLTGCVPMTVWLALISMPLHLDDNGSEKEGTLRFD